MRVIMLLGSKAKGKNETPKRIVFVNIYFVICYKFVVSILPNSVFGLSAEAFFSLKNALHSPLRGVGGGLMVRVKNVNAVFAVKTVNTFSLMSLTVVWERKAERRKREILPVSGSSLLRALSAPERVYGRESFGEFRRIRPTRFLP